MTVDDSLAPVRELITEYVDLVRAELSHRWTLWARELGDLEKYGAIGGLLARQVSLATQIAMSPGVWNPHIAPVLLRSMVDTHITLAWIIAAPVPRARQYIRYGLGQFKLHIEHLRASIEATGDDPTPTIEPLERWLSTHRFPFLTEVNVGNWSEMTTRAMAEELGEMDLYNLAYSPLSASTHSMWHHIVRFNLAPCRSPLHRHHQIPVDPDFGPDPHFLFQAAEYVQKSFNTFDAAMAIVSAAPSALDALSLRFDAIGRAARESPRPDSNETPPGTS